MQKKISVNTDQQNPKKVPIWESSIRAEGRKNVKPVVLGQILVVVMILLMINMLYGYAWNTTPRIKKGMKIAIYDEEEVMNGRLPNSISQALQYVIDHATQFQLNYKFVYLRGKHTEQEVKGKVEAGEYWGALMLHQNSSVLLSEAVFSSQVTYHPNAACTYWYDQGRDGSSYQYALSSLGQSIVSYSNSVLKQGLFTALGKSGNDGNLLNPRVLAQPVGVTVYNLHPVKNMGLHVAAGNGMLQLNLVAIIQAILILVLYAELEGRGVIKMHLLVVHIIHRIIGSILLALWCPITLLALGAGQDFMPASKFFAWWAFCSLFLATLSAVYYFAVVILGVGVGMLFAIFFLILQIASSTGSIPLEAMPEFFMVGMGLPFANAIQGSRTILFGSNKNFQARNIGVFCIYIAVFMVLSMLVTYKQNFKLALHLFKEDYEEPIQERIEEGERQVTNKKYDAEMETPSNPSGTTHLPVANSISICDPRMHSVVIPLLKKSLIITAVLSFVLFILLLITYGNSWNPDQYFSNITIAFLNTDSGPVGVAADQAQKMYLTSSPFQFNVHVLDAREIKLVDLVEDVRDGKYWAALVVDSEASLSLARHINDTSSSSTLSYNSGKNALHFIFDQGRSGSFVPNLLRMWAGGFSTIMSSMVSSQLLQKTAILKVPLSNLNPSVLSSPISLTTSILNAPQFSGVDGSIGSTAMVLYLGTMAQIGMIRASYRPLELLGVYHEHRVVAMAIHLALASLTVSIWPVFSLLWYGLHVTATQFFAYWALLALGMAAFASFAFASQHLLGQAAGGIVSIIMFSLSQASSTSSLPLELQNPFFKIGLALPYNQIITGGRYILLNSKLDIGRAVGVLVAWVIFVSIASYRMEIRQRNLERLKEVLKCGHSIEIVEAEISVPTSDPNIPVQEYRVEQKDADLDR